MWGSDLLLRRDERDESPPGCKEGKIRNWYSLNKVCIGIFHCVFVLERASLESNLTYVE